MDSPPSTKPEFGPFPLGDFLLARQRCHSLFSQDLHWCQFLSETPAAFNIQLLSPLASTLESLHLWTISVSRLLKQELLVLR